MKFVKLDELWEEDSEIGKIIMVNDGILKLLDILTAKQMPVRLRSRRAGMELMAAIEPGKRPELSDKVFDFAVDAQVKHKKEVVQALAEALEKGSCNFMPKEKIEFLHDFFTGLEIGME